MSLKIPPRLSGRKKDLKIHQLSLPEFDKLRNKVLIIRGTGGLGDILMHRMLFEDFKKLCSDIKITFAIPSNYFPAVIDHPFIDEVVDYRTVDPSDFLVTYVTTTACGRHENSVAPYADLHRSDIWAAHCGLRLISHEMHFRLSEEEKEFGRETLQKIEKNRKIVLFSPISAMESKNLSLEQIHEVVEELEKKGFCVVILHTSCPENLKNSIPVLSGLKTREFFAVIDACDAVISVDTGTFHAAGGFKKPLLGIYSWADGLVYGKWYDCVIVQKHRSYTPGWDCGPCFKWYDCPKCKTGHRKPCLTDLTAKDIITGFSKLLSRYPQLWKDNKVFSQGMDLGSDAVAVVEASFSQVDQVAQVAQVLLA